MTLLALWRIDNKGSNIELSKPARRLVQWSRQDRVVARTSVVVIKRDRWLGLHFILKVELISWLIDWR